MIRKLSLQEFKSNSKQVQSDLDDIEKKQVKQVESRSSEKQQENIVQPTSNKNSANQEQEKKKEVVSFDNNDKEKSKTDDSAESKFFQLKKQELDKIKWQAFEEGKATAAEEYAEKLEEYEKNLEIINNDETKLAQTLNAIKNKIESIDQQMVVIFNKWSDQCLMLSYGIACKVIEKTKETIPVEIIASYLHKRLPSLRNELQIQILLNPLDLSKVQERIKKQKINSSNNCLLKFLEDDTVQSGDCTIQIEGGEFVKNSDKMLKEIEESLQNYLSHSNIKTNKENFTSNDNG